MVRGMESERANPCDVWRGSFGAFVVSRRPRYVGVRGST